MTDRIDDIALRLIESRIRNPRSQGSGAVSRIVRRVIVTIRTADGLTGWGEAAPWAPFGNIAETTLAVLDTALRPVLLGTDPAAIRARMADCAKAIAFHPEAKSAVEMALWDIAGQRANAPVHALLGGAVRTTIPLSFSIADPDFAADLDRARAMFAQGHRILKVKTGYASHADDLRRLAALRDALTDLDLRVDYNQALGPCDALVRLRDVEGFRPTFIEQPVPRGQERAMASLAAALDTPILADESVYDATELLRAVRVGVADCVSIKLGKCGGIGPARALDAVAEAAGWPTYGGTLWEGGIALAAAAHVLSTLPNMTLGCEFYMPSYALEQDVVADVLQAGGGFVRIPDGPGLGVTIDAELLDTQTVARC
ncbi:MAG TPA: enolase C-terminal domain-like protein [Acetobacteraceae bacterium]|jgi:muconate cycloisomerase|nr:enolase C-terminal domain-like protein [Acetobacteraceae bacterium]